jgi:hypothetical protein
MAHTRAPQVLSALLGAGFKEEFQRRVRIQSYDQKVGRLHPCHRTSLDGAGGMPRRCMCEASGVLAQAQHVSCSRLWARRMAGAAAGLLLRI